MRYGNMPMVAQNLPTAESLNEDKGIDLTIYQCSGCGLVQLDSESVSYYRDVIRAAAFSPEMKEFRIKQFGDFVQTHALAGKKVFEAGCGKGEYLVLMQEVGADAYGLEHAKDSVEYCVQNGLNVSEGFIDDSDQALAHGPFDAFFTLNFLEHLPDPNAYLRGIYNNLTDDGVGIVEVPNFDMMVRNNLFSEFMCDHLLYFTKESLIVALQINGFEVVSCEEVWHDYIISAVVRKRKKIDLDSFSKRQNKIENEIDDYVGQFKRIAIWGAGHQAFAIMSLADLGGKVAYVVDSASFKQGKYTPATHIPIVAPNTLQTDPVNAIIVMAGSYSDEIAKTIREQFDENISVAILRDFGLERN